MRGQWTLRTRWDVNIDGIFGFSIKESGKCIFYDFESYYEDEL